MPYLPPLCSARKGNVADMDVCGIWIAVGLDTIGFELKDVIFGCGYGLLEHTVVKTSMVTKVPVGCGLGVAAGTEYQMVQKGQVFGRL